MGRKKIEYTTTSRECYNNFIARYPDLEKEVSYQKFKDVIYTCNSMPIEYCLKTGVKYKLPYGFGNIVINRKKLKMFKEFQGKKYVNLRIDWAKTRKEKKVIYHTNEHTDGFNFSWMWFPKSSRIFVPQTWTFKACRSASRSIAKYLKKNPDNKEFYLEWSKIK